MKASPFFTVASLQEKWYRPPSRGAGPALGSAGGCVVITALVRVPGSLL